MNPDGPLKTFIVAGLLCIVCSVLVSSAAVILKPLQEKNKQLDIQKNILLVAGLLAPGPEGDDTDETRIALAFQHISSQLIDLKTGKPLEQDPGEKTAKDPQLSYSIPPEQDLGKIKTRSKWGKVYRVKNDQGEEDTLILPIRGKGLWSTLYGFLALEKGGQTVRGIGFYQHGETPGLGGEIDNPAWIASWRGKQVMDETGRPVVQVLKGAVSPSSPKALQQIDGLSGATITSRGVENLLHYWLGPNGYGPFLNLWRQSQRSQEDLEEGQQDEH